MYPSSPDPLPRACDLARAVLNAARDRGATLGVGESLTGGLVTAALVAVPGASDVLRGGVTAYASDLKVSLLGVDRDVLARYGPVHADVARQMAAGAARLAGASWGLATTGVAGPGPQDGHASGRVHVAVWTPEGATSRTLDLAGDRQEIRTAAVAAVLDLALSTLREQSTADGR